MDQIINIIDDTRTTNADYSGNHIKLDNIDKLEKGNLTAKFNWNKSLHEVAEELKEYSWEEKFEWSHQKKLKASRLFPKKRYEEALYYYMEALVGIVIESDNELEECKARRISEQVPILLNITACLNERKEHAKGVAICNEAIKLNTKHPKSYYRRGICYQHIKEYGKAREDLKKAIDLCEDDGQLVEFKKAYDSLKEVKSHIRNSSKDSDEVAFNSEYANGLTVRQSSSSENLRILKYNDDLEELSHWGPLKYIAYPIKRSYKFVKTKSGCCRRRKDSYIAQT